MKAKLSTSLARIGSMVSIVLLLTIGQTVAQIELVKDVNPRAQFFNEYGSMTEVNGLLYFAANNALWVTKGTPESAIRIKSFRWIGAMVSFNNTLIFVADDGSSGRELWMSHGTKNKTMLLKDVNPGGTGSDPRAFTILGRTLFFVATTARNGVELWRTDGTRHGTFVADDIIPGPESSYPDNLVAFNNKLVFVARDIAHGREIRTLATWQQKSSVIRDILPDTVSSNPTNVTVAGAGVFFSASVPASGNELWKTDGTSTGTMLVNDIRPGSESSYPGLMITVNGTLFFIADDGISGSEFWKSNGTTAGTTLAFELTEGSEPSFGDFPYDEEYGFYCFDEATANGKLYFTTRNLLYESDGTQEGTHILGTINFSGCIYYSPRLYEAGGTIYLFVLDEGFCCNYGNDWHLAKVENSTLVTVRTLPRTENMYLQIVGTSIGIFFPFADETRNFRLWMTDGTGAGTAPFHDAVNYAMSSYPRLFTRIDDYVTFYADDDVEYGVSFKWRSDGTTEGTYRTSEFPEWPDALTANASIGITPYNHTATLLEWTGRYMPTRRVPDSANIHVLEVYRGFTYFTVSNPTRHTIDLWKTDGTRHGTTMIRRLSHETSEGAREGEVFNDVLYFSGTPQNIWRTDGTVKGTYLIGYAGPGAVTDVEKFIALDDVLLFRGTHPDVGTELFRLSNANALSVPASKSSFASALSDDTSDIAFCYPNPSSNAISFGMRTETSQPMTMTLRGVDGRIAIEMEDLETNNTYSLHQPLSPGLYLMYLQSGSIRQTIRVVRLHEMH